MKKQEYLRYNAFISYRHSDLDKFVAENLHKLIETYKMPQAVVDKYNIYDNNIRRVFRDQEELPLSPNLEDPIIEALKSSEFLIVICSPRLKESLWCKKEIETFIKYHGRNDILCVLVEGEPDESFPEELLYYEEKIKKDGKTITKKVPCEPLAMDVRGSNKREVYKNLKEELIRVMAPLYRLNYDDIKRRHEERELKRKAKIFKTAAIVLLIFSIYSFSLFSKIYISSKQLKHDQSVSLANDANNMYKNHDRLGAVEKAYHAVTKYNNIKMPVTAEGIYQLTNSLGVYQPSSSSMFPVSQLNTLGLVSNIKADQDIKLLLTYDDAGEIILWNLKSEKIIKKVNDTLKTFYSDKENEFTFVGKKSFAYLNNNDELVIISLKGKVLKKIKYKESYNNISASKDGKYVVISGLSNMNIYDTDNYKLVCSYKVNDGYNITSSTYLDTKGNALLSISKEGSNIDDNDMKILTFSIKNKKVVNEFVIDSFELKKILFDGNNAYVLSNRHKKEYSKDMIITSYNYLNGKKNYQKEYKSTSGKNMEMTFSKDGDGTLAVVDYDMARILDLKTGELRSKNSTAKDAVYIQKGVGAYRFFNKDGTATQMQNNDDLYSSRTSIIDFFGTGLRNYKTFLYTDVGYLGVPSSDNRVIIYSGLENKEFKKLKDYKEKKVETIEKEYRETIIKDYNFSNSGLISNMFYSDNKSLLFVVYNHNVLEVYDNKNKKLLSTVDNINKSTTYYIGKTKNNEYLIRTAYSGGYVLNKNFELIAYVPNLYDYKDGKLIIKDYKTYYEVPLYTEKEIIDKGKRFLESKGRLE